MHRTRFLHLFATRQLQCRVHQDSSSIDLPAKSFYGEFSYDNFKAVDVPGLSVELFPFQKEGVGWMIQRERFGAGGIMADHLGMGKTVQMLGLCLGADSISTVSQLDDQVPASHSGFRILTVLRQLSRMAGVASCTKLNRPAREVHKIAESIEAKIQEGHTVFTREKEEMEKWLSFSSKFFPAFEKRARTFVENTPLQMVAVEAKVLRTLVIVPAALMLQWKSEIETKIDPQRKITVFVLHGKSKNTSVAELENYDFVVTTYDTVVNMAPTDESSKSNSIFSVVWKRIILDEAHVVRHASTQRWRAVLLLKGAKRWAITATPLHNSIDDIQNLLHFTGNALLPVIHKSHSQEILDDPALQKVIAQSLQPIFLRRGPTIMRNGIKEVLVALPPKHEAIVSKPLSDSECSHYNKILSQSRSIVDGSSTTAHIFSLMTKLRLTCCHPWLADTTGVQVHLCGLCKCEAAQCVTTKCGHTFCQECLLQKFRDAIDGDCEARRIPCPQCATPISSTSLGKRFTPQQRFSQFQARGQVETSTKLEMILAAIEAMLEQHSGDKMIIFSHFTSFLDVIELTLLSKCIETARLDGTMTLSARNSVIRSFQTSHTPVLLASKTATGVGLNLTMANHVIIVDPWWNPAIEEQAVHRCHRIGQKKPVHVSRFVISDTIEHYCFEIAQKKKEFGDAILRAASSEGGAKAASNKLQELLARLNYVGAKL
ncbi:DNA excision repair protein SNF2, putative [Bodo saltans]|uniref:DNA excision repair protein SNF2, putative n=1 Tax=Bodo saltans TaxID=75058 RepID=A0A0S4JCY2_BODSA|nr:DNA excision repair protein SNF2, putative [Bodo saltans]|eukprot:CUG87369.1 DNA excision repair protein SNF2, putative [Bodo saltans]